MKHSRHSAPTTVQVKPLQNTEKSTTSGDNEGFSKPDRASGFGIDVREHIRWQQLEGAVDSIPAFGDHCCISDL